MNDQQIYSVSDALAVINQTLEYAYPTITVEGEVANYKISGGKWVFFDLKDNQMLLKCFMPAWNLRTVIEDGMKILVKAKPRLGKYGFSLNVDLLKPVGEGSIKKSFELLKSKLEKEGLFSSERKRILPDLPEHVGIVSSVDAAGYKDFLKIIEKRFGGMKIDVANTAVQGIAAPNQIINALNYFNESANPPEVIVILRGGGSRDDLVAFDDELLTRTIAASRIPTLVGVGHEIDITLADLAADKRASTPSNAAQIIIPDKREIISNLQSSLNHTFTKVDHQITYKLNLVTESKKQIKDKLLNIFKENEQQFYQLSLALKQLNPKIVLERGYAIIRDKNGKILHSTPKIGDELQIELAKNEITALVKKID